MNKKIRRPVQKRPPNTKTTRTAPKKIGPNTESCSTIRPPIRKRRTVFCKCWRNATWESCGKGRIRKLGKPATKVDGNRIISRKISNRTPRSSRTTQNQNTQNRFLKKRRIPARLPSAPTRNKKRSHFRWRDEVVQRLGRGNKETLRKNRIAKQETKLAKYKQKRKVQLQETRRMAMVRLLERKVSLLNRRQVLKLTTFCPGWTLIILRRRAT